VEELTILLVAILLNVILVWGFGGLLLFLDWCKKRKE
jgi:hypothetical protein